MEQTEGETPESKQLDASATALSRLSLASAPQCARQTATHAAPVPKSQFTGSVPARSGADLPAQQRADEHMRPLTMPLAGCAAAAAASPQLEPGSWLQSSPPTRISGPRTTCTHSGAQHTERRQTCVEKRLARAHVEQAGLPTPPARSVGVGPIAPSEICARL
jgi:hypothetical protein